MYKTHLSAKTRSELSKPARAAIAHFEPGDRVLDYGCGKGGDMQRWQELGFDVTGYDPYYQPKLPRRKKFDVVTNFYVLNVISSHTERIEMLSRCWDYTGSKLIVAALLGKETKVGERYFTEFSAGQVKRMIIYVSHRLPLVVMSTGVYMVLRDSPEVKIYDYFSAEDAIAEIRRYPVANEGDFISNDRGRILYHSGGKRRIIKGDRIEEMRSRIARREQVEMIKLCTF